MRIVLCPTLHQHDREVTLLDRLMRGTTDGAVLMLPEESSAELKALQRDFPVVVVDPRVALDEGIPVVSAAHAAGARAATEHLLALGHRRIGAITGPPEWIASTDRLNGYHGALAAAGVMPDPALVAVSDFRNGPVTEAAADGAARPARSADGDLCVQRQRRGRRDAHGARSRPEHPRRSLRGRLRRLRAGRRSSSRR